MTEPPTDPCVHCGHPRTGHGTRYATIPGRHEWAAQPITLPGSGYHLVAPQPLVRHWPQEQA